MAPTPAIAAVRLTTAELTWLLSLRPGESATLVATALGLSDLAGGEPPARWVIERRGEVLPRGEAAVVGDVLTSASALISVGTANALAGIVAIGRDRVLILAPSGADSIEVVALEAATTASAAAAALAARIGAAPVVMVAIPGGAITEIAPGPSLAERVQAALP